jgi:hypothetical protein
MSTTKRSSPRAPAKTAGPEKSTRTRKPTAAKKPLPPPPPPPPPKILAILESQKQLGAASYPPTLARLADLCGDTLAAVKKDLSTKDVKGRALLSRDAKAQAAPEATLVLFAEDAEEIARADRLLSVQLHAARTPEDRAVDAKALCKGLAPPLQKAFAGALARRLEERRMPPGIGAVSGEQALFFLVADAILPPVEPPAQGAVVTEATPPNPGAARDGAGPLAEPFAARFDAAFVTLDRASGGHNYVTLGALRAALPDVPRATFDAELSALRRGRRYTLDPSDGRHQQMTEAEKSAGIMEAGNLLVYVARRSDA